MAKGEKPSEEIQILAKGPDMHVITYNSYLINGYNFRTKSCDEGKSTQSSGLVVFAETSSFSSVKDINPIIGKVPYYSSITDIIELNYSGTGQVVLFKCDWIKLFRGKGVKKDKYGVTLVNFNHLSNNTNSLADEPFILASQATQVYYVRDLIDQDWYAVRESKPRDFYDMGILECESEKDVYQQKDQVDVMNNTVNIDVDCGNDYLTRNDINGTTIDLAAVSQRYGCALYVTWSNITLY